MRNGIRGFVLAFLPLLAPEAWGQVWEQANLDGFGSPDNYGVTFGIVHGQVLVTATSNEKGSEVWSYDGTSWLQDTPSWAPSNEVIWAGAEFQGSLYIGTGNTGGAEVWRHDGTSWSEVAQGALGSANWAVTAMSAFRGELFVGTVSSSASGGEVWRYDGSSVWTKDSPNWSPSNEVAFGLVEFEGHLFVGSQNDATNGGEVWAYQSGSWSDMTPPSMDPRNETVRSMAVWNGSLYVGTDNEEQGAEVWRLDAIGGNWTQVGSAGMIQEPRNTSVSNLAVHDGDLYAGIDTDGCTDNPAFVAAVLRYDGSSWSQASDEGFGDDSNCVTLLLGEYEGHLYVGTDKDNGASTGGEVWKTITGTLYCGESQNPNNTAGITISSCDSSSMNIGLTLLDGPPGQFCYLLVGNGNSTVSQPPGAKGDLCVVGGNCLGRYDKDVGLIDSAGTFSIDIKNALSNPCAGGVDIVPGATWNFQFWHRQPMGQPATFSSALSVTFL